MGTFSVSHYTRLEARARGVGVVYALDFAEVATSELLRPWKLDAASPPADLRTKANEQMRTWVRGLDFRFNGKPVAPRVDSVEIALSEGAAGLPVARITAALSLALGPGMLLFEDRNLRDRSGWKEIVIASDAGTALIEASHSSADRTNALTSYPAHASDTPPRDLRASLAWTVDPAAIAAAKTPLVRAIAQPAQVVIPDPSLAPDSSTPQPSAATAQTDYLSRLLSQKELTPWMIVVGLLVAFGLGAVHATSPGHGKTLAAAYLVGSKGTMKHAAILGAMTTFTHTVSVFALGLVTLFLSQYILPETLLPWLGAISGLSIVAVGGSLFFRRLRILRSATARPLHSHNHAHSPNTGHSHGPQGHVHSDGHPHAHGIPHSYDHAHAHALVHDHGDGQAHSHEVPEEIGIGGLIALGASGGLVPCPSALVLLLTSIALGRIGLGLLLLTSFSLGLAAVLVGIGMLVLYAKSILPQSISFTNHPAFRFLPVASAAIIVVIGFLMTSVSLGWVKGFAT